MSTGALPDALTPAGTDARETSRPRRRGRVSPPQTLAILAECGTLTEGGALLRPEGLCRFHISR